MSEPNENTCWVRVPDLGQFRGEGVWERWDELCEEHSFLGDVDWEYIVNTNYLPTYVGVSPPSDEPSQINMVGETE